LSARPGRCSGRESSPPPDTLASLLIIAASVAGSTAPVTRIRDPFANSISIVPGVDMPAAIGSAATWTAAKVAVGCARRHNCRRHPYSWPGCTPASRATPDTPAPGSSEAAISRSLKHSRNSGDCHEIARPLYPRGSLWPFTGERESTIRTKHMLSGLDRTRSSSHILKANNSMPAIPNTRIANDTRSYSRQTRMTSPC
jgi:hypothetical protein